MSFRAVIYDINGNETNTSTVVWELITDFNATEGNNSKLTRSMVSPLPLVPKQI